MAAYYVPDVNKVNSLLQPTREEKTSRLRSMDKSRIMDES